MLVDTRFIDLPSIPDDIRYCIFDYLREKKGIRLRDLSIKPYQADKIKNRKRRVTDDLLKHMLELLTPEEYAELVEGVITVRVDPNTFIKILVPVIMDPILKLVLVEFVKNRLATEIFPGTTRYTVTE